MKCPNCEEEIIGVSATHDYSIELDPDTNQYTKHDISTEYVCQACGNGLGISDIEDILKQVDEL